MPKYFSGRSKRTPQSGLTTDRYQYLSIEQAEPNLGDPPEVDNIPTGNRYQVISVQNHPGERYWLPVGGGVQPGAITVREDDIILPPGANEGASAGVNSITDLNFKGNILTAVGWLDEFGNPGTGVTITAAPIGKDHDVIFNNDGEFGAATGGLTYDNDNTRVGIASTQPDQTLDIDGSLFISGNVFDRTKTGSGTENQVLVRHVDGGLVWADQSITGVSDAAGDPTQVQFHNADGKLGGGTLLVYDYTYGADDERVGIGSTQPTRLLDVLGDSRFVGVTTFEGNVFVEGVVTSEDVTNIDSIGIVTAGKGLRVTDGGIIVTAGETKLQTTRFADDISLYFGDDDDLQILHDGNDSIINDNATGSLKLQQGGNTRLEVTGAGVTVTGVTTTNILSVTGFVTSHLIPSPPDVGLFDLGSEDNKWDNIYANTINVGTYNPITLTVEQLKVTGLSTFVGLATFNDGLEVISGLTTFSGITTVTGDTLFTKQFNVAGISSFVGFTTFKDDVFVAGVSTFIGFTTFRDDIHVTGLSTFVGFSTFNDVFVGGASTFIGFTTFRNDVHVTGLSTFVGFSTFGDAIVGGMSTFVGISSFEGNVSFNGGLKDYLGNFGGDGQILESRDDKVKWISPAGLSVESANKVGIGSIDPTTAASIYYPTFVKDNNKHDDRQNEYLYNNYDLVYFYDGSAGIGSVGIGTIEPKATLDVLGISSFSGNVYLNGIDGDGVGITSLTWQQPEGILKFQDDIKAIFGTGDDLSIYYTEGTGSDGGSVFKHTGDHDMRFQVPTGSHDIVFETTTGVNLAVYNADGAVELSYSGSGKKFETSAHGVKVTGITTTDTLGVAGIASFWGPVWDEDGSPGETEYLLESTVTGVKWKTPDDITVQNALKVGVGTTAAASDGISTSIYYPTFVDSNNTEGRELEYLYSNHGLSYNVYYEDGNDVGIGSVGIGTSTPNTTLDVLGISSFRGDVYFNGTDGDDVGITSLTWKQSTGTLEFKDNVKAAFGDGNDFNIEFDGTNSIVAAPNSGELSIRGKVIELRRSDLDEPYLRGTEQSSVEIYYNNAKKLETSGVGVTVTGLTTTTTFMVKEQFYDKDGEAGNPNDILTSTGSAVEWTSPQGLGVENSLKVGVGTTAAASDGISTSIYYPTFVDSNNETRDYEYLYSNRGLSYNVYYEDGNDVGISSVGIGTSTPRATLDVLGITSFRGGDVYFNGIGGVDNSAANIFWDHSSSYLTADNGSSFVFGQLVGEAGELTNNFSTRIYGDGQGNGYWDATNAPSNISIWGSNVEGGTHKVYINPNKAQESITATANAGVQLFYAGQEKIKTITNGVQVTGKTDTDTLYVSGEAEFDGKIKDKDGSTGDSTMVLQPDGEGVKWKKIDGLTADNSLTVRTVGVDTNSTYFLTFVEDFNDDPNGQQEGVYTGIGITVNANNDYLYLGGSLHLDGTDADTDGDIHSWGGLDGEFTISNEGSGPIHLLVQDTNSETPAIGIVSFSSHTGSNAAARQSIFASNIYPKVKDTYNIGESETKLRWNNVYAKEYHGDVLRLNATDDRSKKINLESPAGLSETYTLTLPLDVGGQDDILQTDGAGVLSWTNVVKAQAEKANSVGIGTTTNEGGDDLQSYYLPFVRDNNDHDGREYEQLYSDSRLVFNYRASDDRGFVGIGTTNPRGAILHLESDGPIIRLTDRNAPTNNRDWHIATNTDNILRFQAIDDSDDNDGMGAGGGNLFDFYREDENINEFRGVGAGVTWFVVDNKNENVGIGTTNPIASDSNTGKTITDYLRLNTSVLAVGVVTCHRLFIDGNEIFDGGGGGGGLASVEVTQYSDDLGTGPGKSTPRTVRSCDTLDAPITVTTNDNIAYIGIGSTSNAYGNRYISENEPVGNLCEGDIWYDTSGGESSEVTTGVLATVLMYEKKDPGQAAGQFTGQIWQTRKLNTTEDPQNVVTSDPDGGDGQTGSYFKLKKGTYKIEWETPAYQASEHKSRLTISNNADFANENIVEYVYGTSEFSGNAFTGQEGKGNTKSYGTKTITLTSTTAGDRYFQIEHFKSKATYTGNDGLGVAVDAGTGAFEIYSRVRILKLDVDGIGSGGGGGGADKFIDLTDTPSNYGDAGNKVVSVKSDSSGLEFTNRGATVTTSDTAPSNPSSGDLWWNSTTGILNVYYDDEVGTPSAQWVNATGRGPTGSADVPIGGIIMWSGSSDKLNTYSNWELCNGNNGTPDLRNQFIIGANSYNAFEGKWKTDIEGTAKQSGGSKDAVVVSHAHTWSYTHDTDSQFVTDLDISSTSNGSNTYNKSTSTNGDDGTNANLPPYYSLAYIMRVS